LQHAHRLRRVARLGVEIRRLHQRLPLNGLVLSRIGGNVLELGSCLAGAVGGGISYREFRGHIALQRILREGTPEPLEHHDGAVPLLQYDELSSGVVLRIGTDLRFRRDTLDPQGKPLPPPPAPPPLPASLLLFLL